MHPQQDGPTSGAGPEIDLAVVCLVDRRAAIQRGVSYNYAVLYFLPRYKLEKHSGNPVHVSQRSRDQKEQ